jgi:hypothetical protein
MSYTFLLEQGEESSADSFSDIAPYVQSRLSHTLGRFCYNGNEMESSRGFQSGMMSLHSTGSLGGESSMLCVEVSHAKTSPPLEVVKASKGPGVDCGWKWQESSVKWSHSTSSWRTRQCSLLEGLDVFSETWPKWGIMRDGECWEQTPLEPVIIAPESGYVPTPCASDYKGGARNGRDSEFKHWLKRRHGNSYPHPQRVEEMMLWPIGWSELEPLETDKFREWLRSHGSYWKADESADGTHERQACNKQITH